MGETDLRQLSILDQARVHDTLLARAAEGEVVSEIDPGRG